MRLAAPASSTASSLNATTSPAVTIIRPAGGMLSLDLRELWEYRELLYFFVWRDVKVRYKQTVIGAAWAVIQPFFTMVIFSLFFGYFARLPPEGLPYPLFYYSALVPWTYFASALTSATNSVIEHQSMIKKVYFPRVLLPAAAATSPLIDLGIAFLLLLGMIPYYGLPLSSRMLLVPVFVLLLVMTSLAVSAWFSALNATYRDVRYAVPFIVQVWMFASPVAYPSSLIPEAWRPLYALNPLVGVIEGFRWAITGQGQPSYAVLLVSAGAVALLLFGGLVYFKKSEAKLADIV
jgi:lipopolysaccharide transport system permease protein